MSTLPADTAVLALDIGGTKIAAGIVEWAGDQPRVTRRHQVATPARDGADAVVAAVVRAVRAVTTSSDAVVVGCGVATAGVVDPVAGRITHATGLIADWAGTTLGARLRDELGLPVTCLNDVHAQGLAEAAVGHGAGDRSVLLVAVGTGIGGAFVRGGRLEPGSRGAAWHLGHLPSPEAGDRLCSCGRRGHLEAVASGSAIGADRDRPEVVRRAGFATGRVIGGLLNALDPDVVALSGGVVAAGEPWLAAVREGVARDAMDVVADTPVLLAETGADAALLGAAISARRAAAFPRTLPQETR